jgi:hypothetical protein
MCVHTSLIAQVMRTRASQTSIERYLRTPCSQRTQQILLIYQCSGIERLLPALQQENLNINKQK